METQLRLLERLAMLQKEAAKKIEDLEKRVASLEYDVTALRVKPERPSFGSVPQRRPGDLPYGQGDEA